MTRLAVALMVVLIAAAIATPSLAHSPQPPHPIDTPQDVEVNYDVRIDERTSSLVVRASVEVPESVQAVGIDPPRGATITGMQGFEANGEMYVADDESTTAALTYRVETTAPEIRLNTSTGPHWAVFGRQALREELAVNPDPGADPKVIERVYGSTITPRFPGVYLTLLGRYDVVDSAEPGQNMIRIIVPDGVSIRADRGTVLSSLGFARRNFDVGHRHDALTAYVVSPPQPAERFVPLSVPEFVISGAANGAGADSEWLHQYVHTRQNFSTTPDLEWLYEASAEYHAGLLAYQHGSATWAEFSEVATTDRYADVNLRTAIFNRRAAQAEKGAAIIASLDAEIRRATDGQETFEDVMRRLNRHEGVVDSAEFEGIMEDVAGGSTDIEFGRLVTGTADLEAPDPALFGAGQLAPPGANETATTETATPTANGSEMTAEETTATASPTAPTPTASDDETAVPPPTESGTNPVGLWVVLAAALVLGGGLWAVRRD